MKLYLELACASFIESKRAAGKKEKTIVLYRHAFSRFESYLAEKGIEDLRDVNRVIATGLISYSRNLKHYRTNKPLSEGTWHKIVNSAKELYRYLYLEEKILSNPFEHVELPKKLKKIPKDILTEDEIILLFEALEDKYGLFGLAVGELFYGTGLRLSELIKLKKEYINLQDKVVYVKEGKGDKDRMVPIPSRTVSVLQTFAKTSNSKVYFFEKYVGKHVSVAWVEQAIKNSAQKAGITKRITPHVLRHTFATHLLKRGMDIRYIQELLGHEEVTTTEIYTKVEPEDLKKVHRKCHPRN